MEEQKSTQLLLRCSQAPWYYMKIIKIWENDQVKETFLYVCDTFTISDIF